MTEDTSGAGGRLYVYVKDWERFQPRADRPNLPWLRLHTDLLGDDEFLELSTSDRWLLIGIWMLTQRYGLGRVSGNIRSLRSQLNVRKGSLERLVEAGFITLSTTKGEPSGHQIGGLEERRGTTSLKKEKESARGAAADNGDAARAERKKMLESIPLPEGFSLAKRMEDA